jgi:hypothetical protein
MLLLLFALPLLAVALAIASLWRRRSGVFWWGPWAGLVLCGIVAIATRLIPPQSDLADMRLDFIVLETGAAVAGIVCVVCAVAVTRVWR